MNTFTPTNARLGRVSLAFAALISIAAVATPAAADDEGNFNDKYYRGNINDCNHRDCRQNNDRHHRHRHNDNDGFFSFGGGPVYSDPPYYYAPPPRYYYPQPRYYQPGPSFNLTIPLGN